MSMGSVHGDGPPSVADRIVSALRDTQSSVSLQPGFKLTPVQESVYLLTNEDQSYHVKWIPAGDKLGQNEVSVNTTVLRDNSAPAPRMVFVTETDEGIVAAWEKLDGADLRVLNRGALPEAFGVLGRFHRAQRRDGPIHSNITDKDYAAVREMLRDELDLHCSLLSDGQSVGRRCTRALAALEQGFTTLVHGDFHPGNIIVNAKGVFFLDWAYAHRGVNLLDLDYVQSIKLESENEELPWWTIGPAEAGPVLSAYFEACGLSFLDPMSVHRAVMLHAELRSHTNARKRGNDAGAAVALRNIHRLLDA
jgi:aminoglycoside phosphotransferase (APT) family kinase protein